MIKEAIIKDLEKASHLAELLWPNSEPEKLKSLISHLIENKDSTIYLAFVNGEAVGYAQCQLRKDYVEGTNTSPVGYLEGLFVKEEYRKLGIASKLVTACEHWAKKKGCLEFASDCNVNNENSLQVHLKLGFIEVNRIICFKKNL